MRIEEDALLAAFGDRYRDYMRRTWRLIPSSTEPDLPPDTPESAMHPFPHHYAVDAAVRPDGDVPLSSEGVRVIESAPPKEFDGPGNQWSPEQLLTAAVADCFVLELPRHRGARPICAG